MESHDGNMHRWNYLQIFLQIEVFRLKDDAKNVKTDVVVIATAGIVTTGDSWMFTKVINEGDSKAICHSRKI